MVGNDAAGNLMFIRCYGWPKTDHYGENSYQNKYINPSHFYLIRAPPHSTAVKPPLVGALVGNRCSGNFSKVSNP